MLPLPAGNLGRSHKSTFKSCFCLQFLPIERSTLKNKQQNVETAEEAQCDDCISGFLQSHEIKRQCQEKSLHNISERIYDLRLHNCLHLLRTEVGGAGCRGSQTHKSEKPKLTGLSCMSSHCPRSSRPPFLSASSPWNPRHRLRSTPILLCSLPEQAHDSIDWPCSECCEKQSA